jgi:hypothetical protein
MRQPERRTVRRVAPVIIIVGAVAVALHLAERLG